MKKYGIFILAVLAGAAIGFGGIVFLAAESKALGALFFSIGLFMVLTMGLNLFTGKVCYLFDNPPSYIISLIIIWLGNFVGAGIIGYGVRATRLTAIVEKATSVSAVKLSDDLLSVFILAILCNVMIYVAVDGFKNNKHEFGKYVGIFLCIFVFVYCGFEHCVANMFYFSAANVWNLKTLGYLIVMTLGNSVGGVIFPLCKKLVQKASITK